MSSPGHVGLRRSETSLGARIIDRVSKVELLAPKLVQSGMKIFNRCISVSLLLSSLAVCAAADVQKQAREMADLLALQSGDQMADLGAGNGEWSVALAEIVGNDGKLC